MKMQFVASLQSTEISTVVSNRAYILRPGVAKQLVLSSPLKAIRPHDCQSQQNLIFTVDTSCLL